MNNQVWFNSLVCCMVFVLAGCTKNNKRSSQVRAKTTSIDYREIIAKHSEIPDPMLGFVVDSVTHDQENQHIVEIVYRPTKVGITVSQQDIKQLYVADMELLGWKQIGEFTGNTIQLIFERPKAQVLCSVYIQNDGIIRVTLLDKKEGLL